MRSIAWLIFISAYKLVSTAISFAVACFLLFHYNQSNDYYFALINQFNCNVNHCIVDVMEF